jgi:hypothetical protein
MIPKSADNPYIICGDTPGEPLVYLDAMWRRIRKRTGFHDLRIHDLRRTVGSWLVRDGASLHLVGAVLNHKDQKSTAGYAYFQTEDRQRALDRHGQATSDLPEGSLRIDLVGTDDNGRAAIWYIGCWARKGLSPIGYPRTTPGLLGEDCCR